MKKDIILFKEKQRFKQVWLWVVILGVAAIFWIGLFYQVLAGAFGNNLVSNIELVILVIAVGIGLPYFFYSLRLKTEVIPGELRVRFYPFHIRQVKIPLHLVREYKLKTYNAIAEYGGWGIRWGFKGKAYNVSGNKGVELHFYNRKPLLIGSQRAQELYEAINKAKESKKEL